MGFYGWVEERKERGNIALVAGLLWTSQDLDGHRYGHCTVGVLIGYVTLAGA